MTTTPEQAAYYALIDAAHEVLAQAQQEAFARFTRPEERLQLQAALHAASRRHSEQIGLR